MIHLSGGLPSLNNPSDALQSTMAHGKPLTVPLCLLNGVDTKSFRPTRRQCGVMWHRWPYIHPR